MNNTQLTAATLLGVPLDLGAENLGVDIGPNAFRYQGIIKKLRTADLDVSDTGDATNKSRHEATSGNNPRLKYLDEIIDVSNKTAASVEQTIRNGRKAITLGGDHSITLGAFAGAAAAIDGDLAMIYFDAHGDMNTDKTTLTGNIHGMHLAALMGYGAKQLIDAYKPGPKLNKSNLLHIGGSDFDQAELDLVKNEGLQAFMLIDLLAKGMGPLLALVDDLAQRCKNVYVSIDLDSIDQIYAPGAGMPNGKGLTYREIATLAEYIGLHCNVIAVDVVEYNPLQDVENKTAELGIELIARFFGKNYSWYANYLQDNRL